VRRGVATVLLLGLAGCGNHAALTVTTSPPVAEQTGRVLHLRRVTLHETEFRIDPAQVNAGDEGLVAIKIRNDGKIAHALAVDGPNGEVDLDGEVEPGQVRTLQVDLDKPGTYRMWCPLDGHRAKGMAGTITVGGSSPARGAEPTPTATTTTATTPTQTQTQTQTQTVTRTQTTPSTSTSPTATSTGPGSGY
jgi:plastocyanin